MDNLWHINIMKQYTAKKIKKAATTSNNINGSQKYNIEKKQTHI